MLKIQLKENEYMKINSLLFILSYMVAQDNLGLMHLYSTQQLLLEVLLAFHCFKLFLSSLYFA